MNGKITLITPPDFFENSNLSILFFNLTENEQEEISKWFSKKDINQNLNIYLYSNENNLEWLLYALNRCDYKFINLENLNFISHWYSSYILSKSNVYYRCEDINLSSLFKYINQNKVNDINQFLEEMFVVIQP